MAENQQELLTQAIREVRNWNDEERSPYSLEHKFLQLMEANQSEDMELWMALRQALAKSRHLQREHVVSFFTRPWFAEQGYWWWDPAEWVSPSRQS